MINRFYYWKILIQLFSVVHVRKNDTKVQYLSCKCSSLVIGGPQSNKIRGRKCALLLLHLFLITFSKRWLALPSSCKNKSGAEIKSSALFCCSPLTNRMPGSYLPWSWEQFPCAVHCKICLNGKASMELPA